MDLESLPYDAILILRLLLMRDRDTESWQTFMSLASLLEEWRKMDPWEENQEEKIKFIREDLGLTQFSRDEILMVKRGVLLPAYISIAVPYSDCGD